MSNHRRTVRETVYRRSYDYGTFGLPVKLEDWPAFVAELQAKAPEEYRYDLKIDFEIWSSDCGIEGDGLLVFYDRPITKAEIDEERARAVMAEARVIEQERSLLATLKAKYEQR